MNESINNEEAPRRYPELRQLASVRDAGWVFRPIQNADGPLTGIAGSFSRQQYTDAIFIFDHTNVSDARILDDADGGRCVWSKEGADLQEGVSDLLGLPKPGEPGAPNLVKRSRLLWTP
ncbi:hypothetical protein [Amycolatopsis vastitatis]|uniref:Uncharacterized protein n=1 Tax=Amycolatopsis vastitatis TaxID=1905142 RepID=A0A229SJR6_9PSEU|nr:hypothetical protein [Amycolatopsis vastitatis]OXM59152.1 hypothetical protein CF165_49150 [Amycolatopsis vastitatis]